MGRAAFVFAGFLVVLPAMAGTGCVRSQLPTKSAPSPGQKTPQEEDPLQERGLSLASFADELALSLEPSRLEDETTATAVYVFNRGSRTWVIALDDTSMQDGGGGRSLELDVRDAAAPDRELPPAPIGITAQCPRAPSKDIFVVGPGERGLLACVERLVDVRNVEELELEVGLHFKATDGSEIHVRSPAFRVARRPPAKAIKPTKNIGNIGNSGKH